MVIEPFIIKAQWCRLWKYDKIIIKRHPWFHFNYLPFHYLPFLLHPGESFPLQEKVPYIIFQEKVSHPVSKKIQSSPCQFSARYNETLDHVRTFWCKNNQVMNYLRNQKLWHCGICGIVAVWHSGMRHLWHFGAASFLGLWLVYKLDVAQHGIIFKESFTSST